MIGDTASAEATGEGETQVVKREIGHAAKGQS